jgi:hypothetical protein
VLGFLRILRLSILATRARFFLLVIFGSLCR